MSTIDRLTALADRIRTEAYIADRPGQMGRLEAIADELADAEEIIRADEVERRFGWVTQEDARAWFLADLRAAVEALRDESARELGSNLSRNEISERVGEDTAYAAVLALLPKEGS